MTLQGMSCATIVSVADLVVNKKIDTAYKRAYRAACTASKAAIKQCLSFVLDHATPLAISSQYEDCFVLNFSDNSPASNPTERLRLPVRTVSSNASANSLPHTEPSTRSSNFIFSHCGIIKEKFRCIAENCTLRFLPERLRTWVRFDCKFARKTDRFSAQLNNGQSCQQTIMGYKYFPWSLIATQVQFYYTALRAQFRPACFAS
jgi:hypothetical protein